MLNVRRLCTLLAIPALFVIAAAPARADEITFKNGDVLRGKIVKAEDGKLTIASEVAGDLTVNLADVRTFTTDEPLQLRLKDGSIIHQRAVASEAEGSITTEGGTLEPQQLSFDSIESINFTEKWTGSLFVGGSITRGNSDTEALDARFDLTRRTRLDRTYLEAGYFYSRQEDPSTGDENTTADHWFVFGKYDYFFSKKLYAYASTRIERDRIALLDLRLTPSVGVGYQWIERDDLQFFTEAGLAWVYEDYTVGDSADYVAARLAYGVIHELNDRVTLFHNLEYLPSLEDPADFTLNADAGIRAHLTDRMFSEFRAEWRHDSAPAPGADKNDLRLILGIGLEI